MSNFYGPIKPGDSISSAWGNDVEDLLGSGTPAQAYNYIVWKSGSTYYNRNSLTGEREEDTNFRTMMNNLILDLYGSSGTGTGGSIFIMPGYYPCNGTINMRPSIHIYGATRAGYDSDLTVLSTNITATTDAPIFKFDYPTLGKMFHSGIHCMWLDGANLVTTNAIIDIVADTQPCGDTFLDDLCIVRGKYGIRLYNNHASNLIWNAFIERCFVEQCTYNAILLDSPTDQKIFQCRILKNHFYANNTTGGNGALEIDGHETRGGIIAHNTFELENLNGIYLADEADGWVIANNVIIDAGQKTTNTYDGISLNDVDLCSVTGNVSIYRANNKMKYGYYADNNCTYLCVLGNVFKGQTAGAAFGTGTGNVGDETMNVSTT